MNVASDLVLIINYHERISEASNYTCKEVESIYPKKNIIIIIIEQLPSN